MPMQVSIPYPCNISAVCMATIIYVLYISWRAFVKCSLASSLTAYLLLNSYICRRFYDSDLHVSDGKVSPIHYDKANSI